MSLKPSQETERLEIVQKAARHLLDVASEMDGGFGTMDIFPASIGSPKRGSTDYTWRGQIAWCWAKAGWLGQRLAGQGLQKHWVFKLLPQGRRPLEMIASDPVVASFYVRAKRPTSAGTDYPATWYQAPELRDLEPEPEPEPESKTTKRTREESPDQIARDAGDPGDAADLPGLSDDGDKDPLVGFLERNFQALQSMIFSLGEIKKEVKAQSDLVLEVAQKFAGGATKEDLADVAAELASALAKRKGDDSSAAAVAAVTLKLESVEAMLNRYDSNLASEFAKLMDRRKADDEALADKIGKSIATAIKKDVDKHLSGAGMTMEAVETVSKYSVVQMGKLKDETLAAISAETKRLKAPAERAEKIEARIGQMEDRLGEVEEVLGELEEVARRVDSGFMAGMAEFKKQSQGVVDAQGRALDTCSELIAAARAIVKEMLDVGMERAAASGVPFSVIKQKGLGAIDRLNEVDGRVSGRKVSGADLIRPPGGFGAQLSGISGGIVPLPPGVDVSGEDDDEDDEGEEESGA